jgi:hypothetical protein
MYVKGHTNDKTRTKKKREEKTKQQQYTTKPHKTKMGRGMCVCVCVGEVSDEKALGQRRVVKEKSLNPLKMEAKESWIRLSTPTAHNRGKRLGFIWHFWHIADTDICGAQRERQSLSVCEKAHFCFVLYVGEEEEEEEEEEETTRWGWCRLATF